MISSARHVACRPTRQDAEAFYHYFGLPYSLLKTLLPGFGRFVPFQCGCEQGFGRRTWEAANVPTGSSARPTVNTGRMPASTVGSIGLRRGRPIDNGAGTNPASNVMTLRVLVGHPGSRSGLCDLALATVTGGRAHWTVALLRLQKSRRGQSAQASIALSIRGLLR